MLNIKERELALKTYYNYYKGEIDNIEGQALKTAYYNFQKDNGLKADKIYGKATDKKLKECIANLQLLLNNAGYNLVVDSIVGNATINAIKDFQSKNGLTSDGIAGKKTFAKLNEYIDPYMSDEDWNNSKYFKKEEFKCSCGGKYCDGYNNTKVYKSLVTNMNILREYYGKPITITSGIRCKKQNKLVGGVTNSKHLLGKACDFYITGKSNTSLGRRFIVNKAISLANSNYCYCNGYGKTKTSTSYPKSSTMGNAVHLDVEK